MTPAEIEIERAAIEAATSELHRLGYRVPFAKVKIALAAYDAAKWQPIETAPIGFSVLTNSKHGLIQGDVEPDGTVCGYYWREMNWYATHWMPLPQPPEQKRSAADE